MRRGLSVFAFVAAVASATDAPIVPHPAVDPYVNQVETGGFWEIGEHHGRYRVVITKQGFEERSSQIRFEWIEEFGDRDITDRIVKTEVLHELLLGTAALKAMEMDDKGVIVTFEGSLHDGSQYECRVILRPTGIYSKSPAC